MALETDRIKLPYPTERSKSWYATYVQFVQQLDAALFASREDRNIFLLGGGTLTWNASTSTLTWSAAIQIVSPHIGSIGSLASGSLVITAGRFASVELTRYADANYSLTATAVTTLEASDNILGLLYRSGNTLVWRNGLMMDDGYSGSLSPIQGLLEDVTELQTQLEELMARKPARYPAPNTSVGTAFVEVVVPDAPAEGWLHQVYITLASGTATKAKFRVKEGAGGSSRVVLEYGLEVLPVSVASGQVYYKVPDGEDLIIEVATDVAGPSTLTLELTLEEV